MPATILLAEDDADLRALIAWSLRRDGHEVVEVADGSTLIVELALFYLSGAGRGKDVLLVTDLRMPGMDPFTVLETLHQRGRQPPFILLTAFGSPEVHQQARDLGALAVFDKPFDIDELREVVRRAIETVPALLGAHSR
jgi:CheY-like chemotaxis protein